MVEVANRSEVVGIRSVEVVGIQSVEVAAIQLVEVVGIQSVEAAEIQLVEVAAIQLVEVVGIRSVEVDGIRSAEVVGIQSAEVVGIRLVEDLEVDEVLAALAVFSNFKNIVRQCIRIKIITVSYRVNGDHGEYYNQSYKKGFHFEVIAARHLGPYIPAVS